MDKDINYRARKLANHKLLHFQELTSTNSVLETLYKQESLAGADVVMADHQTQGRGMRGNAWYDDDGKNLLFSLLLEPEGLKADEQFYISKYFSICLLEAVEKKGARDLSVKWPNDLYLNDHKLGGILIQLSLRNDVVQYAILGAGINVNQPSFPEMPNATSLIKELGEEISPLDLMESILSTCDQHRKMLLDQDWHRIDQLYHKKLWKLDQVINYTDGQQTFKASLLSVQADGRAEFEMEDGSKRLYAVKEISPA